MGLSVAKASTQDNSAGVPVATTTNEDGSAGNIGLTAQVGNKTIYAETSRTGLTAADAPTGGNMTSGGFGTSLIETGNMMQAMIRATCGTASATLKGRLAFYDSAGACIGISPQQTFISDATLRLGNASGDFIAPPVLVDLQGARQVKFFVDSVSAGTWAVYVRPI
jgi:hypothetical protein